MRRPRTSQVVSAVALVAISVAALGVLHHVRGARLSVSIAPRPALSIPGCRAELRRFGWGSEPLPCEGGAGRDWYRIVVRNVGHRGAWVQGCSATATDATGRTMQGTVPFDIPLWFTAPGGVGARPYLDPGRSKTLEWFAPSPGTIGGYTARCVLIVYAGPGPI
jgi:hypothetical protein